MSWVEDEIDRLAAFSYEQLLAMRNAPRHHPFVSKTGRQLVGETCVHWDGRHDGPLRVIVDVWEPKRLRISRSIATDDFIRDRVSRS